MSRLQDAIERIVFARGYTLRLLETVSPSDWFKMPAEGVTHIAWQVGHIAYAEYRLTLLRLRGVRPEDEQLMLPSFQAIFRPQTEPSPDASKYPTPAEIRATLDRVHAQVMLELPATPDSELDSPITPSHDIARTKLRVFQWCAEHELVHAGQIALLRRLCGNKPIW
jgi:uncharacterized damage-inducible protein DinB